MIGVSSSVLVLSYSSNIQSVGAVSRCEHFTVESSCTLLFTGESGPRVGFASRDERPQARDPLSGDRESLEGLWTTGYGFQGNNRFFGDGGGAGLHNERRTLVAGAMFGVANAKIL